MKKYWIVGVYSNGRWVVDLKFKRRSVARRVHKLIHEHAFNQEIDATIVEWND